MNLQQKIEHFKAGKLSTLSVSNKVEVIKTFLQKQDIKTVVLGISGGIDSALVLALLVEVQKELPLKIVCRCYTFSMYDDHFQKNIVTKLMKTYRHLVNFKMIDLSDVFANYAETLGLPDDANVLANVSYALRYNALFAEAQAHKGVTFGTTNFDEFGYVGWFGKNSDMVVDVQPIADLHKFEVAAMATQLSVPDYICNRTPTGDLLDGSSDEDNFGCTYDELSWFTDAVVNKWQLPQDVRFSKVITLHNKNLHKYQGQSFNPIFLRGK